MIYSQNEHTNEDLTLYINSSNKPILTREEERNLFIRMKNGDKEAWQLIVESNLKLVASIAKRYKGLGVEYLDLIQEGNIGLIEAIERFDVNRDCKLSTYATWWIKKEISRSIKFQGKMVRLPVHLCERVIECCKVKQELTDKLHREPTLEEIAENLNTTTEEVFDLIQYNKDMVSLNSSIIADSNQDLIEVADSKTETAFLNTELSLLVDELFENCNLTEREQTILKLRFGFVDGEEYTLENISNILGMSREAVRQVQLKTMEKIRKSDYAIKLVDYLDDPDRAKQVLKDSKILEKKKSSRPRKESRSANNLYEYFSEYDEEEITRILGQLRPNHLEILHARYGDDFKNPVYNANIPQKYKEMMYGSVLPGIRKRLEKSKKAKVFVKSNNN